MTTLRSAFLAGFLAFAVGACTITPNTPSANVAGSWSGTFHDSKSTANGTISAIFTDQSNQLSGSLTINGWACSLASNGNVSGSVSGDELSATTTFGLATALTFNATVSGNDSTGTYDITSGVCSGSTGTFSMSR